MKKYSQKPLWLLKEGYTSNVHPIKESWDDEERSRLEKKIQKDSKRLSERNKRVEELAWLFVQQAILNKKPKSPETDKQLTTIKNKIEKIEKHKDYFRSEKEDAETMARKINLDLNKRVNREEIESKIFRGYNAEINRALEELDDKFPVGRDCSDITLSREAQQAAKEVGESDPNVVKDIFKKLKADCVKQHKAETQKPPSHFQRFKTYIGLEESLKLIIKQTIKETLK